MLECGARFLNEAANKEVRGQNWLEKDKRGEFFNRQITKTSKRQRKGKKGKERIEEHRGMDWKATGVQIIGNQG